MVGWICISLKRIYLLYYTWGHISIHRHSIQGKSCIPFYSCTRLKIHWIRDPYNQDSLLTLGWFSCERSLTFSSHRLCSYLWLYFPHIPSHLIISLNTFHVWRLSDIHLYLSSSSVNLSKYSLSKEASLYHSSAYLFLYTRLHKGFLFPAPINWLISTTIQDKR